MLLFNNKTFSSIYSNGHDIIKIYHGSIKVWEKKHPPIDEKIILYFGASNTAPRSLADMAHLQQMTVNQSILTSTGVMHNIKTGDANTQLGQYPVLMCPKTVKPLSLIKWTTEGVDFVSLPFKFVETDYYDIYYLNTPTYDQDIGGTNYSFLFKEA